MVISRRSVLCRRDSCCISNWGNFLEILNAGAYTILADETKDCSKKEQLAIVVRYVDVEAVKLFEHFLTYVEATALDASSLSGFILDTLKKESVESRMYSKSGI